MKIRERHYKNVSLSGVEDYRYGFNGKELDKEVAGTAPRNNIEFKIYNSIKNVFQSDPKEYRLEVPSDLQLYKPNPELLFLKCTGPTALIFILISFLLIEIRCYTIEPGMSKKWRTAALFSKLVVCHVL